MMLVKTKAHILGDKQIQIAIPIGIQKAGARTDFLTCSQTCFESDIGKGGVTVVSLKDGGSEVDKEYRQMESVVRIVKAHTQLAT